MLITPLNLSIKANLAFLFLALAAVPLQAEALTAKQIRELIRREDPLRIRQKRVCKNPNVAKNLARSRHCDPDSDKLTNYVERILGTKSKNSDSDGDGLDDRQEVMQYRTSPKKADTDGDGLSDGAEVLTYGTNPRLTDSDGDGISDGEEVNGPPCGQDGVPPCTPTPTATPCPPLNFDESGNTTAFGIPPSFVGNISAGHTFFQATCAFGGCHLVDVRGINYRFQQLKSAVMGPPMNFNSISDPDLANLTAFLNQTQVGGCP